MRCIVRSSGPRTASTMQNSDAPRAAVSRAAPRTSSLSRNGVANTGDSNLADCEQKWQSSGHPPVLADRIPSTSTVSPHHASRTSWARAARAGTSASGMAASNTLRATSAPLGPLLAGLLLAHFSAQVAIAVLAAPVVVAAIFGTLSDSIRNLPSLEASPAGAG